jgi:N6-adenosine-specific RNA methylase IME4
MAAGNPLTKYDALLRAIAEVVAVDEIKAIRDQAAQLAAAARIASNHQAEADAVAIRMRATRRLGQIIKAQKESVGLATGGEHGGRPRIDGSRKDPSIQRPTLAMQGVGKRLAHEARVLSAPSDEDFERIVTGTHDKVARAARSAVRDIEIEQAREQYRARTYQGGTVADLHDLIESGFRAGAMLADPAWLFRTYSQPGKQRSAERYYDCMPLDEIKALPIGQLAADDCALFLCSVGPELPGALEVIKAWGFEYQTKGFTWIKTTPNAKCIGLDGSGLHWGMGYHTRSNSEDVLLATKGSPFRLSAEVHQVIVAPVGRHSEKPEEVARRIERLYPGPYLELFARRERPGWMCWGNEIAMAEAAE